MSQVPGSLRSLALVAGTLANLFLRIVLTSAERTRRVFRLTTRPELFGAHAIALTPYNTVVLVKLRYVPGWRLPGGAIGPRERPDAAVLRELQEEIGLLAYDQVVLVRKAAERNAFRRGEESVFLVTGVRFRPRWSIEVEAVRAFDLDRLPHDISPWTKRALQGAAQQLEAARE